jgi:predicted dehydrogenase
LGVADKDPTVAEQFAHRHGTRAYLDYEEMLSDPAVDVICVCTPSCFHVSNTLRALEEGKHVVLEKPMAFCTADADRIIHGCQQSEKQVTVISQLRFSEDVARVKALLRENAFGRISLCSLSMKYYRGREYYAHSSWKGTRSFDGGGALMNQGIHGIDLLQYLMGPVKDVLGQTGTLFHHIEVEDTAVAAIRFESGALGVIEASTCAYPGFERRIELHGDQGYVILSEDRIEKLMVRGEEVIVPAYPKTIRTARDPRTLDCELHKKQMEHFLSAIRGETPLLMDAREGRRAIELIERIYCRQ